MKNKRNKKGGKRLFSNVTTVDDDIASVNGLNTIVDNIVDHSNSNNNDINNVNNTDNIDNTEVIVDINDENIENNANQIIDDHQGNHQQNYTPDDNIAILNIIKGTLQLKPASHNKIWETVCNSLKRGTSPKLFFKHWNKVVNSVSNVRGNYKAPVKFADDNINGLNESEYESEYEIYINKILSDLLTRKEVSKKWWNYNFLSQLNNFMVDCENKSFSNQQQNANVVVGKFNAAVSKYQLESEQKKLFIQKKQKEDEEYKIEMKDYRNVMKDNLLNVTNILTKLVPENNEVKLLSNRVNALEQRISNLEQYIQKLENSN